MTGYASYYTSRWSNYQAFQSHFPPTNRSYTVSVGLVDRLGEHFNSVVGPIGESGLTQLVLGGLNLLVASTACLHARYMYMYMHVAI